MTTQLATGIPIEEATCRAVEQSRALRHRLHQTPELGYEEFKTAAAIRAELDALGIAHVDGVPDAPDRHHRLARRHRSKPCVALRADIDALPIARADRPALRQHAPRLHARLRPRRAHRHAARRRRAC